MGTVSRLKQAGARWFSSSGGSPAFDVAAIAVVALIARVGYLMYEHERPGFVWTDPDGYVHQGWVLGAQSGGWRWTIEAFRYNGPFWKAPLYAVFMGLFASSPFGPRWSAALAQTALGAASVAALWSLARDLHTPRSGFIAAIVYAVYLPSVTAATSLMQERVYVPLLMIAFALLARASVRSDGRWFAGAGAALGLAALTRSMPIYFVWPASALIACLAVDRKQGIRHGAMFLGAFLAIVLPYTVFISAELRQPMLIENIGTFGLARSDEGRAFFGSELVAPTLGQLGRFLWHRIAQSPMGFVREQVGLIFGTFQLGGGRWLQLHPGFPDASAAFIAKAAAHLLGDLPFVAMAIAAPIGLAVARRGDISALLALWVGVHLVMTALSGYGGQRFREPIDWCLLALASAVAAGRWRRPRWLVALPCLLLAAALGWAALRTMPESLDARADYGVGPWTYADRVRTTKALGRAGFTVSPVAGTIDLLVRTAGDHREDLQLRVDGVVVPVTMPNPREIRLRVAHPGPAFVEIERAAAALPSEIQVSDYLADR